MTSWENNFASKFMIPSVPVAPKPQMQAGDVAGVLALLNNMLSNAPMVAAQRAGLEAIRNRLAGVQKDMPPSIGLAVSNWLTELLKDESDAEAIVAAGNAALDAAVRSGDSPGAEALARCMEQFTGKIYTMLTAGTAGPGTPGAEVGDDSAIEWIEPDPEFFYATDDAHGQRLDGIIRELRNADEYIKHGARAPTRMMFVGEAGNGKTAAACYIANQLGKPVALVQLAPLVSMFIGKTPKNMLACAMAAVERDAVLVYDELEAIATRRDGDGSGGGAEHQKITAAVNQLLDMLRRKHPTLIIISATNVLPKIDPSVARRFTTQLTFGPPCRKAREGIVKHKWRLMTADASVHEAMVDATNGKSGALVEELAEEAIKVALDRKEGEVITTDDVKLAMGRARAESYFKNEGSPSLVSTGGIVTPTTDDMRKVLNVHR